jgi:hypothetical protein
MVASFVVQQALSYALIVNGYLLLVMVTASPRVWGYADYPDAIKAKVPAQTSDEKRLAAIIGIPWFLFTLGYPIYSTYALKANLGGEISFWIAFLNVGAMALLANLGDWVVLDWLIITRITPDFVVIPGTEKADYKDLSQHFQAQARASVILVMLCLIMAGIVTFI